MARPGTYEKIELCHTCEGVGTISEYSVADRYGGGYPRTSQCTTCDGQGRVRVVTTVEVKKLS